MWHAGGYSAIEGGGHAYAIRDLTGAAPQVFRRKDGTFERAMCSESLLCKYACVLFGACVRSLCRYKACGQHGVRLMVGLSVHESSAGTHWTPISCDVQWWCVGREGDIGNGILSDHEYSLIRLIDTNGVALGVWIKLTASNREAAIALCDEKPMGA